MLYGYAFKHYTVLIYNIKIYVYVLKKKSKKLGIKGHCSVIGAQIINSRIDRKMKFAQVYDY